MCCVVEFYGEFEWMYGVMDGDVCDGVWEWSYCEVVGEYGRDERDDLVGIDDGFGVYGKFEFEVGDVCVDGMRWIVFGDGVYGEGVVVVFWGSVRELGTEVYR